MVSFQFLMLLLVTVDTVAAEGDSDTDICTDPTKNNCDPNAKCSRVVVGEIRDESSPKFLCECNEGYTGDGFKGNCQKVTDAVCTANCDFTKSSLCNYETDPNSKGYSVSFYRWNNDGKATDDTDSTMEKCVYLGWDVSGTNDMEHHTYDRNFIRMDFDRLNLTALIKETKVRLTVRISSPDMKLKLSYFPDGDEFPIEYGSTKRGWQTVTATIPARTTYVTDQVVYLLILTATDFALLFYLVQYTCYWKRRDVKNVPVWDKEDRS